MEEKEKIIEIVSGAIKEIQTAYGNEWRDLKLDEVPRENLYCYDSYRELETLIIIELMIEKKIQKKITLDRETFYSEKGGANTVNQICDSISNKLKE